MICLLARLYNVKINVSNIRVAVFDRANRNRKTASYSETEKH